MYDQVYRFNVDFAIFVREELLSVNYLLLFELMPILEMRRVVLHCQIFIEIQTLYDLNKATQERIEQFYLCCIRALVFTQYYFVNEFIDGDAILTWAIMELYFLFPYYAYFICLI